MTCPRILCSTALAISLSATLASAGDKKKPLSPVWGGLDIGVLVEHIELDRASASKFVREHDGDGTKLRQQLQKLVDAEKAKILDSAYALVPTGERAKISSVNEFIYPTEYEPPEEPDKVSGKIAPGVNLKIPPNPTAFDMREVGNTVEVEAHVAPGEDVISLKLASDLVTHLGETKYGKGITTATQPEFDVLGVYAEFVVKSGTHALVAVQTPRLIDPKAGEAKRDRSRRVFVMVRATVLPPPADEKQEGAKK